MHKQSKHDATKNLEQGEDMIAMLMMTTAKGHIYFISNQVEDKHPDCVGQMTTAITFSGMSGLAEGSREQSLQQHILICRCQ